LEAGRSCNRSLWSMSTDFRFGSQALQRCSGLLNRGARGSTVATHQFKTEVEPDKRAGTASKADRSATQNGEHDLRLPPLSAGLAEQPCTRLVNEIRPGQHR